jgi:hypothetical protein
MYKVALIALLVVGAVLVFWGYSASESFSSDVSRFFTDSPTDKAIWLLSIGAFMIIVGGFGLLRGLKRS